MNMSHVLLKVLLCGKHLAAFGALKPIAPVLGMDGIFVLPQLVRVARRVVALVTELILDFVMDGFNMQLKFHLCNKALATLITFIVPYMVVH